jgi:hypothetical protein
MSPPRKFDWDEAARLKRSGLSYAAIGSRLGVSANAIRRAVDPDYRAKDIASSIRWQASGVCSECGGRATRPYLRCRKCSAVHAATSVRNGEAKCFSCRRWLPLDAFRRVSRPGRVVAQECRECNTRNRRERRHRDAPLCANCGRRTGGDHRREPPLCRDCWQANAKEAAA